RVAHDQANCLSDYASTLLVAVITAQRVAFYQVGDGLWCVCKNGILAAMTWPTGGEHASETTFVTCESASQVLQFEMLEGGFDSIFGMTDGVERLAINLSGRVPHSGFLAPLARELRKTLVPIFSTQLTQLLESDQVCQRTDDDKTLAIILHEPDL
ncbi:MAG: protein phosphatase 2C domain-containing protein, partial [Verrucomicrobiaceae bacterium]